MSRAPRPSAQDLEILDPDGSFRARLEADRATIAHLSDRGDLHQLGRIVHALAGAAGTFGFVEIGDLAIELDNRFTDGLPATAVEIACLLRALERALERPEKSA